MCTKEPEQIDVFRLQCRNFCDRFEDAFQFSPNGDLLFNMVNRVAVEELTNTPQIRFLIELVTGVFVDRFEFVETIEGDTELAKKELNKTNNSILTQYYGVLYTFYRRMCQADKREPKSRPPQTSPWSLGRSSRE